MLKAPKYKSTEGGVRQIQKIWWTQTDNSREIQENKSVAKAVAKWQLKERVRFS